MVDIERIKTEIENLRGLTAEEYCKEEVAKIYADFEASRDEKINELETALKIFDAYQVVVEETVAVEVEPAINVEETLAE